MALIVASRFLRSRRTMPAWRWPDEARVSICVSRIRTRASSAATKNPLIRTSDSTASSRRRSPSSSFISGSKPHLAKNHLENILKTQDPGLTLMASQYDGQSLAAPLHALQGFLQAHFFVQKKSGCQVISDCFVKIQVRPVENRAEAQNPGNPSAPSLGAPDGQP